MEHRVIRKEVVVNASQKEVWKAWTSLKGVKAFFAPEANIQLSVGGAYELFFDLDAPTGSRGGEGLKVLSYLPMEMLSFEWNAPPQFPEARRGPHTWVVVQFSARGQKRVSVRLTHLGWRDGEEWEKVFQYFQSAWDIVLGRLEYRYSGGTIDWNNPYRPPQGKTYESRALDLRCNS
jgi:uncharacterized protein YndB with AHSA1/START domain